MARKIEKRDVVAVDWTDPHGGAVVRGRIASRTKTSARVEWSTGRTESGVLFGDPNMRFLTADEM